jgi:hypothetical protein
VIDSPRPGCRARRHQGNQPFDARPFVGANGSEIGTMLWQFEIDMMLRRFWRCRHRPRVVAGEPAHSLELGIAPSPGLVPLALRLPDADGSDAGNRLGAGPRAGRPRVSAVRAEANPHQHERLPDAGVHGYGTTPSAVGQVFDVLDSGARRCPGTDR